MQKTNGVSAETSSLLDFVRSLPSVKKVRSFTCDQVKKLPLEKEITCL